MAQGRKEGIFIVGSAAVVLILVVSPSLITHPKMMFQVCLETALNVTSSALPKFCHPKGLRNLLNNLPLTPVVYFSLSFLLALKKNLFSDLKLSAVFLFLSGFSLSPLCRSPLKQIRAYQSLDLLSARLGLYLQPVGPN